MATIFLTVRVALDDVDEALRVASGLGYEARPIGGRRRSTLVLVETMTIDDATDEGAAEQRVRHRVATALTEHGLQYDLIGSGTDRALRSRSSRSGPSAPPTRPTRSRSAPTTEPSSSSAWPPCVRCSAGNRGRVRTSSDTRSPSMASPPVIPTCSTCPSSRNGDRSATGTCRRQLGRVQFVLCHDPFRRVQQAFWYEWHAGGTAGLRRRRDREITCFPTRTGTSRSFLRSPG